MITYNTKGRSFLTRAANSFVSKKELVNNSFKQSPTSSSQPKLTIGSPGNIYEKEADATADSVMRMQIPEPVNLSPLKNSVHRKCAHCEEEEKQLHRKENSGESISTAPPIVHDVLSSGGRSLDTDTRSFMEPRFNYDFSNVKIHDNNLAAKSASSINALAYTSGNNVVFNSGQYNTNSDSGRRLLAHELTHVVQQKNIARNWTIQRQPATPLPVPEPPPPTWIPRVIQGGAGVAEEATVIETTTGSLGGLRFLGPVGAFLAVLLYSSPTAPGWVDTRNPITDEFFASEDEYRRVSRMTPQQILIARSQAQAKRRKEESRRRCFETVPFAISCEEGFTDPYEAAQDFILNQTNYSFEDLGDCYPFNSHGPNKIAACDGAPGVSHHCRINGTSDEISVFGCVCCDEEGNSGYTWRGAHLSDYAGNRR